MRWFLIAGLTLGSVGQTGLAAPNSPPMITPAAAPAAATPAAKAAALRLAQMLHSEESQVAMAERLADGELSSALRNDKNMQTLEGEYPGFIDSVMTEMKPALVRYTREQLPDYHLRMADLIASRFDAAEIADLTAFYQTPTGRKLVQGMQQNATIGSTIDEVMANPDKPTSFSAVTADHKASTDAIKKLIDESDHETLREFAKKPYFARVASLGPAMRKLEQDISNEPSPEFEAEIEAIMTATLARFEANSKKN